MLGTVELVTFGIQAGVKLARTGRKVYVENTISRELVIPLPAGFTSDISSAREYAYYVEQHFPERYEKVFQSTYEANNDPSDPKRQRHASQELIQLYLIDLSKGLVPPLHSGNSDIAGIAALNQWAKGEKPFPDPLQRVAGSLVEIGIEYFANIPGAVNDDSKYGKAIKALVMGLDEFNFQETRWDSLVIALFTAGLETLEEHPQLMSGNEDRRELFSNLLKGVASDLQKRLKALPATGDIDAEDRLHTLSTTLVRGLLRNGGNVLTENPTVLGLESGAQQAFFKETFAAFMNLLTADTDTNEYELSATLNRLASTQGMDRLIRAVLKAGSEHPEFFKISNMSVQNWLQKVIKDLYGNHKNGKTFFDTDLFPEIASLVIEHGLPDLPKLISISGDTQALTVSIARELYDLLVKTPDGGGAALWRLDLSRSDVRNIFEYALHAVSISPAWAIDVHDNYKKIAIFVKQGVGALMDIGEGGFKQLLRGGHLESLLVALLESGLIAELETIDPDERKELVGTLRKVIEAHGIAGFEQVLQSGAIRDLFVAVRCSSTLKIILGDDAVAARAAIEKLVATLDRLRAGNVLSVPEIEVLLAA